MYENINLDTVKDVIKIEEKITEALKEENIDPQKIIKLRSQQLMVGLMLSNFNKSKIY